MLKPKPELIIDRGKAQNLQCDSQEIEDDKDDFITALVDGAENGVARLPANPPFEIHPYKDSFPLQNYEKYIIGTFPPISYILDHPDLVAAGINELSQPIGAGGQNDNRPAIPFYHGNQGSMWDYLLTDIEQIELWDLPINQRSLFLIQKLNELRINYADIIDSTQRSRSKKNRYSSSDKFLNNICINENLICNLFLNPLSKYIIFNSASIFGGKGMSCEVNQPVRITGETTKSFDLFVRGCQELGLKIEIRILRGNNLTFFNWTNISALTPNQRRNKIAFEMKIVNPLGNRKFQCLEPGSEKIFSVFTGPSPSSINILGLIGNVIFENWRNINPHLNQSAFIKFVYESFRGNNFNNLFNLNQ